MGRKEIRDLQKKRKELLEEEKALKDELNKNKDERIKLQKNVKLNKNSFEEARKLHTKATQALNKIHLGKSAIKNLEDLKEAAAAFNSSCENVSAELEDYIDSLQELNDLE